MNLSVPSSITIQPQPAILRLLVRLRASIIGRDRLAIAPIRDRQGFRIVLLLVIVYSVLMAHYLTQLHQTLGTGAEDMGIMDQVLWNTAHGHFWVQTICNPLGDNNCVVGGSRFAIHFEPLMLLLVPLYWIIPGPQTLQCVQVIGVALGAFPAWAIARSRLESRPAGIIAAAAYLVLPVLRTAAESDFHMVTLAAPLLMLALYASYRRNDVLLFLACLAAMATKEQVPLDVFMIALMIVVLQGRVRIGIGLAALAIAWVGLAELVIHHASPLGITTTAARYGSFGDVVRRLPQLITDSDRRHYLLHMLENSGGLGLAAPWTLLMALPSVLLNALSGYANQYSGIYQYNADIAPFLWLGIVEGGRTLLRRAPVITLTAMWPRAALPQRHLSILFLAGLVIFSGPNVLRLNPNTLAPWPQKTDHTILARQFFAAIPANAAVSAQSHLVSHLSERQHVYQFPDGIPVADYILLDTSDATIYPFNAPEEYTAMIDAVIESGKFAIIMQDDGYLLLQRIPPAPTKPHPHPARPSPVKGITRLSAHAHFAQSLRDITWRTAS